MERWFELKFSFRARITFPSAAEGGRVSEPFQGYRPGFQYLGEPGRQWMVFPWFLDEDGREITYWDPVPREAEALMWIMDDELRKSVHQKRIEIVMPFLLKEGFHVMVTGVVLAITGLYDP